MSKSQTRTGIVVGAIFLLVAAQTALASEGDSNIKLFDGHNREWGLALSGGGTRSASFSLGVISQLKHSGVLDKLDAISSVSGGGFAAYFYYMNAARQASDSETQKLKYWRTWISPEEPFTDLLWRPALNSIAVNGSDKCAYLQMEEKEGVTDEVVSRRDVHSTISNSKTIIRTCIPDHLVTNDHVFSSKDNFAQPHGRSELRDSARHQLHISSWRDVLAGDGRYETLAKTNDRTTTGSLLFSTPGTLTIASIIPHFIANTLFDWRINFSPTQSRYQDGIHRTYGIAPVRREYQAENDPSDHKCRPYGKENDVSPLNSDLDILCLYEETDKKSRSVRSTCEEQVGEKVGENNMRCRKRELLERISLKSAKEHWKPLSFDDLNKPGNKPPLWIINASVGKGGMAVDIASDKAAPFYETNFEFTPFGYGDGKRGFKKGPYPSDMTVLDAVAASAAFFDPQQQSGNSAEKALVGSLMHLANIKWGLDIPNYAVGDGRRILHRFLPFPFYYLNGYLPGQEPPYLHVSDGGHSSDNLGVYALIRRGFKNIIAVDGSFDGNGKLDDLCYLRWNLARYHNLDLDFATPNAVVLKEICGGTETEKYDPQSSGLQNVDVLAWPNPVEHLIAHPRSDATCSAQHIKCLETVTNVYYIKLALNLETWFSKQELGELFQYDAAKETRLKKQFQACSPSFITANDRKGARVAEMEQAPPCTLSVFFKANLPKHPHDLTESGWSWRDELDSSNNLTGKRCVRPVFPQHATVNSTLDGTRRSYYAYRDLGGYAARRFKVNGSTSAIEIDKNWGPHIPLEYAMGVCRNDYFPIEATWPAKLDLGGISAR